jgi:hypothetical protein
MKARMMPWANRTVLPPPPRSASRASAAQSPDARFQMEGEKRLVDEEVRNVRAPPSDLQDPHERQDAAGQLDARERAALERGAPVEEREDDEERDAGGEIPESDHREKQSGGGRDRRRRRERGSDAGHRTDRGDEQRRAGELTCRREPLGRDHR